ncbi:Stage 0 sporulation protein KD [Roseibium album]|nr:Stage 0 sporulation protein KD [Roseibium album]
MNIQPERLVELNNLTIRFGANAQSGNATVDHVDFHLDKGEFVALVGESGSGKSLLAHALSGILSPAAEMKSDRFHFSGVDLSDPKSNKWHGIRGREIGVVFQNPRAALSPVRKVGKQIADVIAEHRFLRKQALKEAVLEALAAVRIPDPALRVDAYPHELSGGMCQRIMMAIALAGDPALLIADEATTGLDTTTQAAIVSLLRQQAEARHMACLFISHDLALAKDFAHRIIVMHAGQIVEEASVDRLFTSPRHPYSAALTKATPANAATVSELSGIPGGIPDLRRSVPACRFAGRCEFADTQCWTERPELAGPPDALVACWRPLS